MVISHRDVFHQLPETVSEYAGGVIFLLIGTCANRLEMGDFQLKIRELRPRYDMLLGHGWIEGNVFP